MKLPERFFLFRRAGKTGERDSTISGFGLPVKFQGVDIGGENEAVRLERIAPLTDAEFFWCLDRAIEEKICLLGTHADHPDEIAEKYQFVLVPEKYIRSQPQLNWLLEPYILFSSERKLQPQGGIEKFEENPSQRRSSSRPRTSSESARRVLEKMFIL
ncbi:MAG: hypothetical protein GYB33_09565 [Gammaproteobacteria bacterium]|nr:hypothetical protein [Gammaproteobacteria bacterium]